MIKVNLLGDQSVRTRKAVVKTEVSPMGVLSVAVVVVLVAGLGGWWYHLDRQVKEFTADRDRLRVEEARLKQLRKQIEEFEKMKQDRESRIQVIETLRENQTGPVLLLNHILRCIPTSAALWLSDVDQKGDQIRITGHTVRGETVPDFMSNLAATGFFKSVDLELYEDQQKDPAKFTLLCISLQKSPTE